MMPKQRQLEEPADLDDWNEELLDDIWDNLVEGFQDGP